MSCLLVKKWLIKTGISLYLTGMPLYHMAQVGITLQPSGDYFVPLNSPTYRLTDRYDVQYNNSYRYLHTGMKPYLREEVVELAFARSEADTFSAKEKFNFQYLCNDNAEFAPRGGEGYYSGSLFEFFFSEPATFYQFFSVRLNPVIYTQFGYAGDSTGAYFTNTRGLELRGSIDNKVGFYFYATDNQAVLPTFVQERVDAAPQVMPGQGVVKSFRDNGVDYLSARGYVAFNATKHIRMQFGHDKIFIGDGIRSLIWSDNANAQLMFRIQSRLWRVQYTNMFTELANYDGSNIYNSLIQKKYAAVHHISIPIVRNVHVSLFESIIYERYNATGTETGFELQYLNPVIFYRAIESGLGSSDNVLTGFHLKWNFLERFSLYGQFVLDEFVFKELFSNSGWWGNKYAVQAGAKYFNAFDVDQLDLHYEFNLVRPYTYSYEDDNGSSYTHYAQAIAHPLGANFTEHLLRIRYQPADRWLLESTTMLANAGKDSAGTNYGGNIFLDYNTYSNAYGNVTGQGLAEQILYANLRASWYFWHNTALFAGFIYRRTAIDALAISGSGTFIQAGIQMNAWPQDQIW